MLIIKGQGSLIRTQNASRNSVIGTEFALMQADMRNHTARHTMGLAWVEKLMGVREDSHGF